MTSSKKQPPSPAPRRILILDDHPITRYGLVQLLNDQPDFEVVAETKNAQQALPAVEKTLPDLVIADITMPGKSGLDFIKDLQALHPKVAVLVLSMHDENVYAERVLRAGGRGYIMKCEGGEKLLEAIRSVLQGRVYVSQAMSATILDGLTHHPSAAADARPGALSDREFEVFQMMGQGLSTREIGQTLSLSVKTVAAHRLNIKNKLKVRTGPELLRLALRWSAAQQIV